MAIKGKGRAKTGRRPVTRAPRPGYVEPPKPMYRRTWFRWLVSVVAVLAVVAIVLAIILNTRSNDRKQARAERQHTKQGRVQKYVGPVSQYLQPIVTPLGGGTQVAAFQDLPKQLQSLGTGELSPADAKKAGTAVANNARAAYTNIQKLDVSTFVSGFPELVDLIDSQEMLVASLRLYEQVGNSMVDAAGIEGTQQQVILQQAQAIVPTANQLFSDGYQKMINAQVAAGLPPTVYPAPTTPAPQASGSPVPSPAASGSPSGNAGNKGGKGGGKSGGKKPKPTASAS